MSTVAISHVQELEPRLRPSPDRWDIYSPLWPMVLVSADLVGLTTTAVLGRTWIGNVLARPISALAMVVAVFCASGLYQARAADSVSALAKLLRSICLAGFSLGCVAWEYSDRPSILSGIVWLGFATPVLVILRSVLRSFLIRSGQGFAPAVIIGSAGPAKRLRELMMKHKHLGLRPIAILDDAEAVTECRSAVLEFPAYGLDGANAVQISTDVLDRSGNLAKRVVDVGLASLLAISLSPFFVAISLSIWLSSRGPILFRQTRIGRNGKPFQMWKFRSMAVDAEDLLNAHLAADPEAKQEWEQTQKLREDPRVLPMGRWLRGSSLDELPQLWNVIRGDMSLVGPRPVVREEIARYGCVSELYKSVRPGITGLWQVSGRSNTSYEERVTLDEYYVKNCSACFDLHILIRTIKTLVVCEGAY